jgi:hypothetical protein
MSIELMDLQLKEFIDRAIVPALLERFLSVHSKVSVDDDRRLVLPSSQASA